MEREVVEKFYEFNRKMASRAVKLRISAATSSEAGLKERRKKLHNCRQQRSQTLWSTSHIRSRDELEREGVRKHRDQSWKD